LLAQRAGVGQHVLILRGDGLQLGKEETGVALGGGVEGLARARNFWRA
jgi:hypothetical protein